MADQSEDRSAVDLGFPLTPQTPQYPAPNFQVPEPKKRRTSGLSAPLVDNEKGRHDPIKLTGGRTSSISYAPTPVSADEPNSALHRVSINMVCTAEQLSGLMAGLAGTGTGISIKVDPCSA